MDIPAKVTSKGQVTIPKAVRTALLIEAGDSVVFRLDGTVVSLARTPLFTDLAGYVSPVLPGADGDGQTTAQAV